MLCALPSLAQVADTVVVGQKGMVYKVQETPGSSYEWFITGGVFSSSNGQAEITVQWGDDPGMYHLGVVETSAKGCMGDTVWTPVYVTRTIFPTITAKTLVCEGETITLSASAEDSIYKNIIYYWSTGESTREITATIYEKTVFSCIVFYNGDAVDTAFIEINVVPSFKPSFTYSPMYPKQGDQVTFHFEDDRAASFYWTVNGVVDSVSGNYMTYTFDTLGFNYVSVTAFNMLGCNQSAEKRLNIEGEKLFFIPTAFTPNEDGNNEHLIIDLPEGLRECKTTIYNRWGNIVFKSNDVIQVQWDGKVDGSIVQAGGYVVDIVAYTQTNKYMQMSQAVSVLR